MRIYIHCYINDVWVASFILEDEEVEKLNEVVTSQVNSAINFMRVEVEEEG